MVLPQSQLPEQARASEWDHTYLTLGEVCNEWACMTGTTGCCGIAKHPLDCRLREAEVQKCMESASQSDRGFEEAQAKGHQVGFPSHPTS